MRITKIQNLTLQLLLPLLATVFTFTSCSEDDCTTLTALSSSDIEVSEKTVSSLTFTWKEVENATQYGYRLLDADGNVIDGGVTSGREATFTGLTDNTAYTFELTAFAKYGDKVYKNADPITLIESTAEIVPLDTPAPVGTVNYEKITVTWDAIENADTYYVKVVDSEGNETNVTQTETTYTFTGTVGLTYTVSVSADTEAEAYSQSDWGTTDGLIPEKSLRKEVWRVTGTFTDNAVNNTSYEATLIAYDDGSYIIPSWMGNEGYDLEFIPNDDGSFNVGTSYDYVYDYDSYTYVYFGEGDYDGAYIYKGKSYTTFSLTAGKVWFYAYYGGWGQCTFTWDADDTPLWYVKGTFTDESGASSGGDATLVANSDGTYTVLDWLGYEGYDLKYSVNDDGTITILNKTGVAGSYDMVEFYPGYNMYVYPTGTSYSKFAKDESEIILWFYVYYYSGGYVDYKWNTDDIVYVK